MYPYPTVDTVEYDPTEAYRNYDWYIRRVRTATQPAPLCFGPKQPNQRDIRLSELVYWHRRLGEYRWPNRRQLDRMNQWLQRLDIYGCWNGINGRPIEPNLRLRTKTPFEFSFFHEFWRRHTYIDQYYMEQYRYRVALPDSPLVSVRTEDLERRKERFPMEVVWIRINV